MKLQSIRRAVVTLGAIATLAAGTGFTSLTVDTPAAQAAELAQPAASPTDQERPGGQMHQGDRHRGDRQRGEMHRGGNRHHGGGNWNSNHRYFAPSHFSHNYWGYGYARYYPQYYTQYVYEPVNVCSAYYFDEEDGVWFCFAG
jgi:hypothetical protein